MGFTRGGVTIATIVNGIKLNENISWNNKVNYYKELNDRFSKSLPSNWNSWSLPKWEDYKKWGRRYQISSGGSWHKSFSSWKELRDYCYNLIEQGKTVSDRSAPTDWYHDCLLSK